MNEINVSLKIPQGLAQTVQRLSDDQAIRQQFADAAGRACANLTREHLFALAGERHRASVAHNFYADAADSVTHEATADAATIRISKTGMAQRRWGGTIRPVNYSHLWIPVHPDSIGRTGREFKDLVKIFNIRTNKGVAARKAEDGTLTVLFALVPEVVQEPDPSVLPSDEAYQSAAVEACEDLLAIIKQEVGAA